MFDILAQKRSGFLNFNKNFEYCCENILNYKVTKFNKTQAKTEYKVLFPEVSAEIYIRKLLVYYLKTILHYFYVVKKRTNLAYLLCKTSPATSEVNDLHVNYGYCIKVMSTGLTLLRLLYKSDVDCSTGLS